MALGDTYITQAELKDYLSIPANKTSLDDTVDFAIETASRDVELFCNRQFNRADTATARKYEPTGLHFVRVDDFWTEDELVVEVDRAGNGTFTEVPASGYELEPVNGVVDGQPGWPFTTIRFTNGTRLPCYRPGYGNRHTVRVTAKWGWESVPGPVKQAALILGAEAHQLKDAPFGVAGADQFGNVLRVRENKMAASKLSRYVRNKVLVGWSQ